MAVKAGHYKADVIIIGGGLAGITAAMELLDNGKKVIILERDKKKNFGGLAKDSFGGIMMVDTPLQRKSGIKDDPELALSDWNSYACFNDNDFWPKKWAEYYVYRSGDIIHNWLEKNNVKFLPIVNWPERGVYKPGNSVPRWHIAWGTGFGIIEAVTKHLSNHHLSKNLTICFEHQVNGIEFKNNSVSGCSGVVEGTDKEFLAEAPVVVAASGGICGGDLTKVKENWYKGWGEKPPETLLNGSHRYADGMIHDVIKGLGGNLTHLDKQWHYAAGVKYPEVSGTKYNDVENKGLSLVPPRSALWMNAHGRRIMAPGPLVGYTDTRFLVDKILQEPGQFSWQIMNWKIAIKELAVSGSEHMKAFRYKNKIKLALDVLFGNRELVNRLIKESEDFVVANSIGELISKMNEKNFGYKIDAEGLQHDIKFYDDQIDKGQAFFNDDQLRRIANFRTYRGDKIRTCKFQKINDPKAMPLIAIREFILSRKSLGGVQTDLECRVLNENNEPMPGLYAIGETAGFGGGGIHGKGSLEGTFLGSCILMGRTAANSICGKKM